jgi:lipopolysaccharide biosynthesis glycosyltransferase
MDVSHLKPAYTPIDDEMINYFDSVIKSYNSENRIIKTDVTEIYKREFAGCPNESAYCSPYTLIRLFADMIDGMPDKILYLDADIMFNRDIHLLYDIDITDYEYAAARDHYGKYLISPNYVNAGVLLFNLKKMKETGLLQKARGWIRKKKLVFADQSAIIRSTTKKKMLPQKFNDQKFLHRHTVIRHFSKRLFWLPYPHTDNIKQWDVTRVHRVFRYFCFDDVLFEYIYLKKKYDTEVKTR